MTTPATAELLRRFGVPGPQVTAVGGCVVRATAMVLSSYLQAEHNRARFSRVI